MNEKEYLVTGMTCAACSAHVKKAVEKVEGVSLADVNLLTGKMKVTLDRTVADSAIIAAVERAGYGVKKEDTKQPGSEAKEESVKGFQRFFLSLGFLIPLMLISMHEMILGWFGLHTPQWIAGWLDGPENALTFGMLQLLLVIPILGLNRQYFGKGFQTLLHGSPNMDSLIAVGSGISFVYSLCNLFIASYGLGHGLTSLALYGRQNLYFESAGMILTLITLGKTLEERSKKKTGEALEKLQKLAPDYAKRLEADGTIREISTKEIQVGDILVAKAGDSLVADGILVKGDASVTEAALTGESLPVWKKEGDELMAATTLKTGYLEYRVTKTGEDTTLGKLIRLVEEAGGSKAPIAKVADKVAGIFVPVVMAIAVVTFLGWILAGESVSFAINCGVCVLVIACPCAMGLATPVAIMAGTGRGAGMGILIKSGEALEAAGRIHTIVFDKTGTLTKGSMKILKTEGTKETLQLAASLEAKSEHPLAEAVLQKAKAEGISLLEVSDYETIPGLGIRGRIDGMQVVVGNRALMEANGVGDIPAPDETLMQTTPLYVTRSGEICGILYAGDEMKEHSAETVEALKSLKIETVLLTGDRIETAQAVGKELGIETVIAGVLPHEKEAKIRELTEKKQGVAMVGDGINDAPALAVADVGIALGSGADIAIESCDVVLVKDDPMDVVRAVLLSRRVMRTIKENLFWAFFYNCIGILIAAGLFYPAFGLKLSPMFGGAAMSLSSLFVVTNALRLRYFGIKKTEEKGMVLTIEGMMCAHCTGRVEKALLAVEGVSGVVMSLEDKTATVTGEALNPEALKAAVTDAGYEVVSIS